MKILQLFSDWKWTGPAEPVLNLSKELIRRGHEVIIAYQKPPFEIDDSFEKRIYNGRIKATDQFHLNPSLKFFHFSSIYKNIIDIFRLKNFIKEENFDILNVHQSHDHIIGGIAARGSGSSTVVIRTDHKRESIESNFGNRILISHLTDGIITFAEKSRRDDLTHFKIPEERICKVIPALDLERYKPRNNFKDMRGEFGIKKDETVIGMVARFQKYRRTEVFLEAMKIIIKNHPKAKLLLVGRSSQLNESVIKPMKRLGIEPWVVLGGYRKDDYIDTLACMDIFVFLMAGSDGTARALREAMAMGKPVIVANRGMLPELVEDGISGIVVSDKAEELAKATIQLLKNNELRKRMGEEAYRRAHQEFRLDRQAEEVERFYYKIIRLGRWRKR